MTLPRRSARQTERRKAILMTMFLYDMERLRSRRVTITEIQSDEWKQMRNTFVDLFMPVLAEQEERTTE